MIIKKLEIGYGGVLSSNYEIVKHGPELVYRYGRHFPANQIVRVPGHLEWLEFARAVMPMLRTWKKEYYNDSRNGIHWKVSIETNEGYYYSCGSNDFPEDFQTFLFHCRSILRSSDFANDFRHSYIRIPALVNVSFFNQRIIKLLQEQRKTVGQLAEFLQYDPEMVRRQLNSSKTFQQEDLERICSFLDELPADFLFDTSPDPGSPLIGEIQEGSATNRKRIDATQGVIVDHFDNTFVAN